MPHLGKRQVANKNRGIPAHDPGGTVAAKSADARTRCPGGHYKNHENPIRTDGGDKRADSGNFRTTSELAVMMEFIYLFEKKLSSNLTWIEPSNALGC